MGARFQGAQRLPVRAGSVTLTVGETTKNVAFANQMPTATYEVFFGLTSNVPAVIWVSAKTRQGFTMRLSVGIAGTVSYLAIDKD
jgi:hypothetical protein